ncbi:MAG TPA: glycosyltransferase [Bryobacteraceae bacterium]|nr:glycosyltransferase [Bryobacteraceae bacterium]
MSQRVKVAFASCFREHVGPFLDKFSEIDPTSELWVVSEFPPPRGRWIAYRYQRSNAANLTAIRAALAGREIGYCAVSLQPHSGCAPLRRLAMRVAPLRTLFYSETLDHFTLRPNSWVSALRYLKWKTREQIVWHTHPGGGLYTFLWRLRHPSEFRRPLAHRSALRAGRAIAAEKRSLPRITPLPSPSLGGPAGISVVIPSRNGRDLLARLLPALREPEEIIVIDNGSDDGTADFLARTHPRVRVEAPGEALSFAAAVNRGIAMARYSHVLLLNNDMIPHDGFVEPLKRAFDAVPDLFCATAQIFFPEGKRREETGKAVMMPDPGAHDFPVHCAAPVDGEDGSYVLYGSGGCSLYDRAKLHALGGFSLIFEPAYVEDLDIGFRAWQRGWPTVFVSASRVTHYHRSTTSRYFSAEDLDRIVERNYLRFLASAIASPDLFEHLWRHAIERLNWKAAVEHHAPSLAALQEAKEMTRYAIAVPPAAVPLLDEERILALGSGDVAVFPGRAANGIQQQPILIATAYMPFPLSHGGAVRMYNLMRRTAADFPQVLITFVDEIHKPPAELLDICAEIVQVRRIGSHVRRERGRPDVVEEFDTPAFRGALQQTLRKWKPSIVQLEFTQMAVYAADCAPARTVMVEHDITIDLYQQLLNYKEDWEIRNQLERWRKFETSAWRDTDCVVVMSDKDRAAIRGARQVVTLPNGVDIQRYRPSSVPPDPERLLFIGSFAHLPNLLAVDHFLRGVWPKLQSRRPVLHIIAGSQHRTRYQQFREHITFPLEMERVIIDDFVADVRPAYEKAGIVIAPLLASAGTNIKIMEAMAMGKAIVSTTAGINGLDLQPGVDVIIEDDPERMAAAILHLLNDAGEREQLGRSARATAEARFNWDRIAEEQSRMYHQLTCANRALQPAN